MTMKLLFFLFLVVLIVPATVSAVGIGATPAKINVTVAPGKTVTRQVEIFNIEEEELSYRVTVDNVDAMIRVEPAEFTIAGNSTKKITVRVSAQEVTTKDATLSIIAKSLAQQDFQASSGIKIPVHIVVAPQTQRPRPDFFLLITFFVVLVATGFGVYQWKLMSQRGHH